LRGSPLFKERKFTSRRYVVILSLQNIPGDE
jgi:hypothetical protein